MDEPIEPLSVSEGMRESVSDTLVREKAELLIRRMGFGLMVKLLD